MTPTEYHMTTTNDSESTTVYVSIPEGRRYRGRVKEIGQNELAAPEQVHPDDPHRWHEMLHYGQPGTGFVQCMCGAVGIPFRTGKAYPE